MEWATLQARLSREWLPGDHVTIVGPTKSGKTHIALHLAEMCRYILILATKRRDPLVSELRAKGYYITSDLSELQWTVDYTDRANPKEVPLHPRVVFWPQTPPKMQARARYALLGGKHREAMNWAEETRNWCVVVDETMFLADKLRLQDDLDSLWFQGRTQGVSVIANTQRPAHVPRLAFSQATYLFISQTSDKQDVERLREISAGIPKEIIESAVQTLDFRAHEFLFIDSRAKALARVIAPPR